MKSITLTLCFTLFTTMLFAQTDSARRVAPPRVNKSLAIVTGYFYYGRSAGELGLGKKISVSQSPHPFSAAVYSSAEFFYSKKVFVAPKIGVWASGGSGAMNLGLSFVCYTNFNESSLQFRPEIGVGVDNYRFYYGRNMRVTNTNFNLVSKNLFGVNFLFNARKLRLSEKQRQGLRLS